MKNNKNINDIICNYIPLKSNIKRINLALKYGIQSLSNPKNADSVSKFGDLINMNSLDIIKYKMINSQTGKRILQEKPRIRNKYICDKLKLNNNIKEINNTINLDKEYRSLFFNYLSSIKNKNSFGFHYYNFMSKYNFVPDDRPVTAYYTDIELAYIHERYKEIHDFIHVLLGYDITVPHELAVKVFESLQFKLPSGSLSSIFGSLKLLDFNQFSLFIKTYIPHIKYNADHCEFLMNIYYEEELETDIDELRNRLNIIPLNKYL